MSTESTQILSGKRVLVTGGTGSLGKAVVRRMLGGELGRPALIRVFSRDEGKHHQMRVDFAHMRSATDEIMYRDFERVLEFHLGDVRDYSSLTTAVRDVDYVVHAAALKQVPSCEYYPSEAVRTNVDGATNLVRAIKDCGESVKRAISISTDKACKPINVMGMTKAIQERIFIEANVRHPRTVFAAVRYGNVVASRGSVVPLFRAQLEAGGPITITTPDMTRFLITLDGAVDTVFMSLRHSLPGETYIPKLAAARITDIAEILTEGTNVSISVTGIRPGEKVHEILVSDEESYRTRERAGYYVIGAMLPEVQDVSDQVPALSGEYSSESAVVGKEQVRAILEAAGELRPRTDHALPRPA